MHPSHPHALGVLVATRRRFLGLELSDLNQRTGFSLLDLMRLERGDAIPLGAESFEQLAVVLGFGGSDELLRAASGAAPDLREQVQPTAEAVERFLRRRG